MLLLFKKQPLCDICFALIKLELYKNVNGTIYEISRLAIVKLPCKRNDFQSGLRFQTVLSSLRVSCKRALRYYHIQGRITDPLRLLKITAFCKNSYNENKITIFKKMSHHICSEATTEVFYKKSVLKNFVKFTRKHSGLQLY